MKRKTDKIVITGLFDEANVELSLDEFKDYIYSVTDVKYLKERAMSESR